VNIRQFTYSILLSVLAGSSGYYSHALRQDTVSFLPSKSMPAMDYFFSPESFSEIENTKALLDALCVRVVAEIRTKLITGTLTASKSNRSANRLREPPVLEAIKELEAAAEEFKGTPQELRVTQDLLSALKRAKIYDRWTEVYLNALYRHPTHELVGRLANVAVVVGKAAGREKDLHNGFRHINGIPLDFDVKRHIQEALLELSAECQFTENDCDDLM
jgi:hypothetical protein